MFFTYLFKLIPHKDTIEFTDTSPSIIDDFCRNNSCTQLQRKRLKESFPAPFIFAEVSDAEQQLNAARLALKAKTQNVIDKALVIGEMSQRKAQLLNRNTTAKHTFFREDYQHSLEYNWIHSDYWSFKTDIGGRKEVLQVMPMEYNQPKFNAISLIDPISCSNGLITFDALIDNAAGGVRLYLKDSVLNIIIDTTTNEVYVGYSNFDDESNDVEVIQKVKFKRDVIWQSVTIEWRPSVLNVAVNDSKMTKIDMPFVRDQCELQFFTAKDSIAFDKIFVTSLPDLIDNKFAGFQQTGLPVQEVETNIPSRPDDSTIRNVSMSEEIEDIDMQVHASNPIHSDRSSKPETGARQKVVQKDVANIGRTMMTNVSPDKLCSDIDILNLQSVDFSNCPDSIVDTAGNFNVVSDPNEAGACIVRQFSCPIFTVNQTILLKEKAGLTLVSGKRAITIELNQDTQAMKVIYINPSDTISTDTVFNPNIGRNSVFLTASLGPIENGHKKLIVSINNSEVHSMLIGEADDEKEFFNVALISLFGENSFKRLHIEA